MSAIASFTLLSKTSLNDLRDAAVPKTFAGKSHDNFHQFLSERGTAWENYNWSGYIFGILLPYLEQERNIDLTNPDFEDLGAFISNVREHTAFVLTDEHRKKYLSELSPSDYSESELGAFCEAFDESKNPEAGKAMLDGIAVLQNNLGQVTSESVVLVQIG